MENEALLISTVKTLKINFYVWYITLILLGIFCFNSNDLFPKLNNTVSVNLQQLLILALLGGIPGILIRTKNKMKTLSQISDIVMRLIQYERLVRIRQSVFFILAIIILFMQTFTVMKGVLMLFLMVMCLCIFIIPTRSRLETEAQLTKT